MDEGAPPNLKRSEACPVGYVQMDHGQIGRAKN